MRKIFLYFSLLLFMQTAFAADSLFVRKPQIPILIDRTDNILVEMRVQAHKGDVLNKLSLQFKEGIDLNDIKALRFFYSGTEATSRQGKHYRPVSYISSHAEGKTKAANPAYSIKQSEVTDIANVVTFTSNQPMVEGVNYYWISIEMKPEASLLTTFTVQMPMAEINNMPATIVWDGKSDVRRMGIGVRHAGDDGASAYRIPGLVTTNNGTLLGVYDIRYNSSVDLQEMVDIGVSRSTDKGHDVCCVYFRWQGAFWQQRWSCRFDSYVCQRFELCQMLSFSVMATSSICMRRLPTLTQVSWLTRLTA